MAKMVFVTNTNDFHHSDRYDGEDFDFPPGERVVLSEAAAEHMFGRGLKDKTGTLQRLGWATRLNPVTRQYEDNEEGAARLARFVFNEAQLTPVLPRAADSELEIA